MAAARDEGLEIVMPDKSLWSDRCPVSDSTRLGTLSCWLHWSIRHS
jgi:hypothetical protein